MWPFQHSELERSFIPVGRPVDVVTTPQQPAGAARLGKRRHVAPLCTVFLFVPPLPPPLANDRASMGERVSEEKQEGFDEEVIKCSRAAPELSCRSVQGKKKKMHNNVPAS